MAVEHLSDDRIQEYLDGVLAPPEHTRVKDHLDSCAQCRQTAGRYRALYHALAEQPAVELSGDFADKVTNQAAGCRPSRFNPIWLWPVAAVAVFVVTHIWFVSLTPVWTSVEAMFDAQAESLTGMLHKWGSIVNNYATTGRILLGAALSLLMVAGLDRLTQAMRRGRAMLLG
jgi:anti-sigma factor RsiW